MRKEYIEKEALLSWLHETLSVQTTVTGKAYVCEFLNKVRSVPSINVPVVHGLWVERKRWAYGKWHRWLECSKCGYQDHNLDMYEDMPFTFPSNYCPECGARMDGDSK